MKRNRDTSEESPSGPIGHIPKLSRKIRACQACQTRKIKCGIEPGQSSCARCLRNGLECIVNKNIQTLLDDENGWKGQVEDQLQHLQKAVAELQQRLQLQQLPPQPQHGGVIGHDELPGLPGADQLSHRHGTVTATAMTRENSPEQTLLLNQEEEDQSIAGAPMASLFEVTKLRNLRSDPSAGSPRGGSGNGKRRRRDFLEQGQISAAEAQELFGTFRVTLSAYLWGGIALVHNDFASAYASSPLLVAAILAVTALHAKDGGRSFDRCYPVFLELVSQSMFDRYHSLDDVRGLCIGAFWLSDLSWKLSGLAVRIATELNVHQSCAKAIRDSPSAAPGDIERARLWYLLYVCDHHFSIAYGRPPVIHEDAVITRHLLFLDLPGITQADQRLHSQVSMFNVLSRAYHIFGPDSSRLVANDEFETLRRFDADLGHWQEYWKNKLVPNPHIALYPAKGVLLHYYYARLQIFSLCLRAIRPSASAMGMGMSVLSDERRWFINLAISSATAALSLIVEDEDMRKAVVGVPLYLLTTIAVASMFLMKIQLRWKFAHLEIDSAAVNSLVGNVIALLDENQACVRHLSHYIGRGLRNMLDTLKKSEARDQAASASAINHTSPMSWDGANFFQDWNQWTFDGEIGVPPQLGGQDYYPLDFIETLTSQMPG